MKRLMFRLGILGGLLASGTTTVLVAQHYLASDADRAPGVSQAGITGPVTNATSANALDAEADRAVDVVAEATMTAERPSGEATSADAVLPAQYLAATPEDAAAREEQTIKDAGSPAVVRSQGGSGEGDRKGWPYAPESGAVEAGDELAQAPAAQLPTETGAVYDGGAYVEGGAAEGPTLAEPESSAAADFDSPAEMPSEQAVPEAVVPREPRRARRMARPEPFAAEPAAGATALEGSAFDSSARGSLPGSGRPGDARYEGPQTASLTIVKEVPSEVQVGREATVRIVVRNDGQATAEQVEIHEQLPLGAELATTTPRASEGQDGALVWQVGTLEPGQEAAVEVLIIPTVEGELGSMARAYFSAQTSARMMATRPALAVEVVGPGQVLSGDEVPLVIRVQNVGTGAAAGVVLHNELPAGLEHAAGRSLEYEVGTLAPNESRELELNLKAAQAGQFTNLVLARGEGGLEATGECPIEVTAPSLAVNISGPKRRYLERAATYTVSVANPGTAPAREIELITYLPRGLKFVEANNFGEYDPQSRTVRWMLEELPPAESGDVTVTAVPIEPGEQRLVVQGKAASGLEVEGEQMVLIEGLAAILFEVVDVDDPIEVDAETTYEIRVINQGTKVATNVRVVAQLPEALKATQAEGPTRYAVEGNRILFEPLPRLAPKADVTFRVQAQGLVAGDARVRVQLLTDEIRAPITKEESTRIYSDE